MSSADEQFFQALADIVFGNPFSRAREQLILRLVPGANPADLARDREALARLVTPRITPWLGKRLNEKERALIEPALLYVAYHRHVPQIDALIERQARQGGAPLVVTFADEVIGDLVRAGFGEDDSVRYFSLFYQLRRGFYFIVRLLAGECESMRRLRESLWNNLFTHDMRGFNAALWNRMEDFSTLILG